MKKHISHSLQLIKANMKYEKYEVMWTKVSDLVRSTTNNSADYDEKYIKITSFQTLIYR